MELVLVIGFGVLAVIVAVSLAESLRTRWNRWRSKPKKSQYTKRNLRYEDSDSRLISSPGLSSRSLSLASSSDEYLDSIVKTAPSSPKARRQALSYLIEGDPTPTPSPKKEKAQTYLKYRTSLPSLGSSAHSLLSHKRSVSTADYAHSRTANRPRSLSFN